MDSKNKENQEKKTYLARYGLLGKQIERQFEELERLRSQAEHMTSFFSDMPHGQHDHTRLEKQIGELCNLNEEINRKIEEYIHVRKEIGFTIASVKDDTLRLLLEYRYIDELTWEVISQKMNYNYRWVLRLHERALSQVTIENH